MTFRPEENPFADMDVWVQVCDKANYMPARFTRQSIAKFHSVTPHLRFTQLRGAYVSIDLCSIELDTVETQVAGSPWTPESPKTYILVVHAFRVLGGIAEPLHSGMIQDVMTGIYGRKS